MIFIPQSSKLAAKKYYDSSIIQQELSTPECQKVLLDALRTVRIDNETRKRASQISEPNTIIVNI